MINTLFLIVALLSIPTLALGQDLPDLLVESMSITPSSGEAGGLVAVDYTIKNQGSGDSSTGTNQIRWSTNTTIDATDLLLATGPMPALAAGASIQLIISGAVIPSCTTGNTYYIGVIADATAAIVEGNENNNTASQPFVCGNVPKRRRVQQTGD